MDPFRYVEEGAPRISRPGNDQELAKARATGLRGLILTPLVRDLLVGQIEFPDATAGTLLLIRRALLYWDAIIWPRVDILTYELVEPYGAGAFEPPQGPGSADLAYLEDQRVLSMPHLGSWQHPGMNSKVTRAEANANSVRLQMQSVLWYRQRIADLLWALGGTGTQLDWPTNDARIDVVNARILEDLPVPADDVPFEEILRFKADHGDELRRLRDARSRIYLYVSDPSVTRAIVEQSIGELRGAIDQAWKAADKRLNPGKVVVECVIRPVAKLGLAGFAGQAAGTGAVGRAMGLSPAADAVLGVLAGVATLRMMTAANPMHVKDGDYAYLYSAAAEGVIQR